MRYMPLCRATYITGDWEAAKHFLDLHPEALTANLTKYDDRALHLATMAGHVKVVEELVKMIRAEDLALLNCVHATALHHVACVGIIKMAEWILEKNRSVLIIPDCESVLPVVFASYHVHKDMAHYLYKLTPRENLNIRSGVALLTSSILIDHYGKASNLFF